MTHSRLADTGDIIRVIQSYTHIVGSLCTLKDNLYQMQPTTATTIVFVDTTAGNTLHRKRSWHIGVRKYYVRELVQDKLIKLMPCGTKEMVADALKKILPYLPFSGFEMNRDGGDTIDAAHILVQMNRDRGD